MHISKRGNLSFPAYALIFRTTVERKERHEDHQGQATPGRCGLRGLSAQGGRVRAPAGQGLDDHRRGRHRPQRGRHREHVPPHRPAGRRDDLRGRVRARAHILRHRHGHPHRRLQVPPRPRGRGGVRPRGASGHHRQRRQRAGHGRVLRGPPDGLRHRRRLPERRAGERLRVVAQLLRVPQARHRRAGGLRLRGI